MRDWGTWGKELSWALRQFPPADRADDDGIDADVLEAEIMSMATEDMHGLHEIIWTLNVSHNAVPKEAKIAAAQSALSSLAARGLIALHRLEWHPERDLGRIPQETIFSVLADPASWEAGKEYVVSLLLPKDAKHTALGTFMHSDWRSNDELKLSAASGSSLAPAIDIVHT